MKRYIIRIQLLEGDEQMTNDIIRAEERMVIETCAGVPGVYADHHGMGGHMNKLDRTLTEVLADIGKALNK
jgi:hypothetical protein